MFNQWPDALQCDLSAIILAEGDSLWTENIKINSDKGSLVSGAFGIKNWTDFDKWNYTIKADTFNLAAEEWLWISSLFQNNGFSQKIYLFATESDSNK